MIYLLCTNCPRFSGLSAGSGGLPPGATLRGTGHRTCTTARCRAAGASQSGEEREAGWPLGPLEPALGPG